MGEEKQYNTLTVFKMSLPIFVELLLQLLVGNIDQFMLSHYFYQYFPTIGAIFSDSWRQTAFTFSTTPFLSANGLLFLHDFELFQKNHLAKSIHLEFFRQADTKFCCIGLPFCCHALPSKSLFPHDLAF